MRGGSDLQQHVPRRQLQLMVSRLVGALAFLVSAPLVSGCLLNFDPPDNYVSTDPTKGCDSGHNCKFDCGSDGCSTTCHSGSQCYIDCGSGGCQPICEEGAECTIDCGSGTCQSVCTGKCTIIKGSGDVQCSGQGCP